MTGTVYDGARRIAREAARELRRKAVEDRARGRKLDLAVDGPSGPLRPEVARVVEVEEADRAVGLLGAFIVETVGGVPYAVSEEGDVLDVDGNEVGRAEWAADAFYFGRA